MPIRLFALVPVLGVSLCLSAWAQPVTADPQALLLQQQKAAYYTQVEYQRCRSDAVELLVKAEGLEHRVKGLEADVQKLTSELDTLRARANAKPAH